MRRRIGAIATSLVLLGSAAGAVVVAEQHPALTPGEGTVAVDVRVPAAGGELTCHPAPESAGIAYDEMFTPIDVVPSSAQVAVSAARGSDIGAAEILGEEAVFTEGAGGAVWTGEARPTALTLLGEPISGEEALLAAGGVWRADQGDLRGLMALPCTEPSRDVWLLGGSTQIGHSAVLTVTNPTRTAATLEAEAWGPLGALELTHVNGATVAPGATETFLLEANASGLDRIAVHLVANGADVSATIADTRLEGITPRGLDVVSATRSPATELLVPVVSLVEFTGEDDPARGASVLLLANPGTDTATAAVTLLGPDGPVPVPGAEAVTVDPGAVYEINLAGLPVGAMALRVQADAPLLAAAQSARSATASAALERAWSPAAEPTESQTLAVPGNGSVATNLQIVLSAPDQAASVTLRPLTAAGEALDDVVVEVPADASAAVAVDPAAVAYTIESATPVGAGLLMTAPAADGELIAILPAAPDTDPELTVPVQVEGR